MLKITYDGPLDIATGKSRKSVTWRNKSVQWSDLVAKLTVTHRTAEKYADYMAAKPDRQDEIKDIGGFVGGYLTGGKRRSGAVAHRQLVTLDIDHGSGSTWEDFLLVYGCAACMYTTHKHSSEKPRIRIVIPLDREIFADEYEPICRRIAGDIGIEAFTDVTTYEATRLMYWPSTSKDGEFVSAVQDGAWLSADEVLGRYRDWKDSSQWPVCSKELERVRRDIKKQEDPLEKTGIIGAFCRTYGIAEAIETFLQDSYEPTAIPDRYTYLHGSTAAGLVLYDDKFAYSHHGSDPCSGKLCNAFDLVRVHKFGLQDEGKDGNKDSTDAMFKFASKDKSVRGLMAAERLASAREDFQEMAGVEPGEIIELEAEEETDWLGRLEVSQQGKYISSINNIFLILKFDPKLKDKLYFDEFENWLKIKGNLPWRVVRKESMDFSDDDVDCLAHYIECYDVPFVHLPRALSLVRNSTKVHPVRDYLNGLYWDGEERLDTLFIDYLGANDDIYTRSATRKTFVAAIARVFEPGVQFDTMLVLVGDEGIGKSTLIRTMANKWFSDCLGDIHDKSGMESLRGVWFMEVSELSGFRRAEEEAIKRFISSRVDIYRPAFGRQLARFPRQTIFFGTSNREEFLKSDHKNRRYLPIGCEKDLITKDIWKDLTEKEVGLIWAEAMSRYQAGESLDLSKEEKELATKIRERYTEHDDRAGLIKHFLDMPLPEDWEDKNTLERIQFIRNGSDNEFGVGNPVTVQRTKVCVAEIWCEVMERRTGEMTANNTKFIHDILKRMKGWKAGKAARFGHYGTQRAYYRKSTS